MAPGDARRRPRSQKKCIKKKKEATSRDEPAVLRTHNSASSKENRIRRAGAAHRPPRRTPFATAALHSDTPLPTEYERMAREAFTLLGHPDADVRLDPGLPDGQDVRGTPLSFFFSFFWCAQFAPLSKIALVVVAVCVLCHRLCLSDEHAHTVWQQRHPPRN